MHFNDNSSKTSSKICNHVSHVTSTPALGRDSALPPLSSPYSTVLPLLLKAPSAMAAVPDKVLRWLWDTVTTVCEYRPLWKATACLMHQQKYHDPNRAYSDVARVLHLYTSVRPRTEVHSTLGSLKHLTRTASPNMIQPLRPDPRHYSCFFTAQYL